MRVRLRGINSITKRLADGTKRTYWYAWKGGPPLRGEPGSPEFVADYNAAVARKVTPPSGKLLCAVARFPDRAMSSPAARTATRSDYIEKIKIIEREFATSRCRR